MANKTKKEQWFYFIQWARLRCGQICRVLITGNHGAVGSVFSILSVIVALVLFFLSRNNDLLLARAVVAVSGFLVLSTLVLGYWALRVMPPHDYAQVSIGGRPASMTLQLISLDIRRACKDFLRHMKRFPPKEVSDLFDAVLNPDLEVKYRRALNQLEKSCARDLGSLLKISALLELASQQLDIPLLRLRNLFFEYDPVIHRTRVQKFIQNLELAITGNDLNESHRSWLKIETLQIIARPREIIKIQEDIFKYTNLHSFLLRMAAVRSTAEATKEYARAVSFIARSISQDALPFGPDDRLRLIQCISALKFLARKQRTHSGFDLNQSCLAVTRERQAMLARKDLQGASSEQADLISLNERIPVLDHLGKTIDREDVGLFAMKPEDEKTTWNDCENGRKNIVSLRDLWKDTVRQIDEDRDQLVASFHLMYQGWCKVANASHTVLVTHGFSTTVREILKRLPIDISKPRDQQDLPDIFVVQSGEGNELDSRLMLSALLEIQKDKRPFRRIAAGDKEALSGFRNTDTKIMVVLGAECFDKKGRVVHPWGLKDVDILKRLRASGEACVVVVAEGYKFHEDLLSISQFYRYHLDRIQLYEPNLIDVIVTTQVESATYDRRSTMSPNYLYERRDTLRNLDLSRKLNRDKHILRRPLFFNSQTNRFELSQEFELLLGANKANAASTGP
jgi:hypothetical protein